MGFVLEKGTYLREPWNILDFIVAITSIFSFSEGINLSALRCTKILRPLRTINSIQGR